LFAACLLGTCCPAINAQSTISNACEEENSCDEYFVVKESNIEFQRTDPRRRAGYLILNGGIKLPKSPRLRCSPGATLITNGEIVFCQQTSLLADEKDHQVKVH
jgi:hypothetical protein